MAKRHEQVLNLRSKICQLGKYSNNTEYHGEDWESAWTYGVSGLMLTKEELNTFRRDPHCHASWYNYGKGNLVEPMPWWQGELFYVTGSFEAEELLIQLGGDREVKLEATEPDPDKEDDVGRPACVLSKITLKVQQGGLTELRGHLTLRPGEGRQNQLLQQCQHREVKLSLLDTRAREKGGTKQPELPMGAPPTDGEASAAATH